MTEKIEKVLMKKSSLFTFFIFFYSIFSVGVAEGENNCSTLSHSVFSELDSLSLQIRQKIGKEIQIPNDEESKINIEGVGLVRYILDGFRLNPELMNSIDSVPAIIDTDVDVRIDLVIADILDQVSLILEDFPQYQKRFNDIWQDKPLRNFPQTLKAIKQIAIKEGDHKFLNRVNKIFVQSYDSYGVANTFPPRFFKKGQFKRVARIRLTNRYNNIAGDPEGRNILRLLSKNISLPFNNSKLTITKLKKLKKSKIKNAKKQYYKNHYEMVANKDKDFKTDFKYKMRKNGKIRVSKGTTKKDRNHTALFYNKIQDLPYKQELFDYLKTHLPQSSKPPIEIDKDGNKHIIFTPSFIKKYQDEIESLTKEFTYERLLASGDDEFLLKFRKWVKSNREDLLSKVKKEKVDTSTLKFLNRKKLPHRHQVIENYNVIEKLYPNRPWEPKTTLIDKKGNPIVLGRGKTRRVIDKLGRIIKGFGKLENLASVAAGGGVLAFTGNPYLASVSSSLSRDAVYARKYKDRKKGEVLKYMKKNSPKNIVGSLVLASGFAGGETAHTIIIGASKGATQAVITGQPVMPMMVSRAALDLAGSYLPNDGKLIYGGDNSDFVNIVGEIFEESVKGATTGAMVAYYTGDDVKEKAQAGGGFGAGLGALQIALMGVRYDGQDYVSKEYVENYENWHNSLMEERGLNIDLQKSFEGITFRKGENALVRLIVGRDTSVSFAGEASMAKKAYKNPRILTHEATHYGQELKHGLFTQMWGVNSYRNGKAYSYLEDYAIKGKITYPVAKDTPQYLLFLNDSL